MKKIYLVQYDNGEEYPEDYEDFTFKYCYSSEEQALQAIDELKQDQDFLENICWYIGLIFKLFSSCSKYFLLNVLRYLLILLEEH